MDKVLIIHYAYELNWHLPEHYQQDAMDWLVKETPRDQLSLIFPKYNKFCWQNAVEVVKRIGYPENESAFPKLVELFQDLNWPGALEAMNYFRTVDKKVVAKYIKDAVVQAKATNDEDWLYFLSLVCEELHIEAS